MTNYLILILAFLLLYLTIPILVALRLKILYSRFLEKINLSLLYMITLIANSINTIAPFRLGSTAAPIILKKIKNISYKKSISVISLEQLIELIIQSIIFIISLYIISFSINASILTTVIISSLALILLLLLFFERRIIPLFSLASRVIPQKISKHKEEIIKLLSLLQRKEKRAITFFSLMIVSLALVFYSPLADQIFLRLFSIDLSYIQIFVYYWLPLFLGKISGLPGGIGIREGTMILILTQFNIPLASATHATIILRVVSVSIVLILGFIYSTKIGIDLFKISKLKDEVQQTSIMKKVYKD